MSVNTSRSGRQRMVVPVFFRSVGCDSSAPTISPFWKCSEYFCPSRQIVTSMYSDAYCVAHAPRPFKPSENS